MGSSFRFKQFSMVQDRSALRIGTDAVLLGASLTLPETEGARMLDIGTGCGVIALMAAQRAAANLLDWRIDAIDIDAGSIADAEENFSSSPWGSHLSAYCIPLRDYRPSAPLDAVFSNPPYFDNSLRNPDARSSAARHTTDLSYRDILSFSARYLSPEGTLSLILPAGGRSALRREAASFGLVPFRITDIRTTPGKEPKRTISEFSRFPGRPPVHDVLVLQDGEQRTEAYNALTKEFYLNQN